MKGETMSLLTTGEIAGYGRVTATSERVLSSGKVRTKIMVRDDTGTFGNKVADIAKRHHLTSGIVNGRMAEDENYYPVYVYFPKGNARHIDNVIKEILSETMRLGSLQAEQQKISDPA
jgi:hypothetical protein